MNLQDNIEEVCRAFQAGGEFKSYAEISLGNINRTYRADFINDGAGERSYIVQRVNTYVFKDPIAVMSNIDMVSAHILNKSHRLGVPKFYHTSDGLPYFLDGGDFYRMCDYIPSRTFNSCEAPELAKCAGLGFGEFQMLLSDFDAARLHETIPDFHNTKKRFDSLISDAEKDPCGKIREVKEELDRLISVKDKACTLTDMYEKGELPIRVTHNDTKINNILFDAEGKTAIAVVDLDTVMPGLVGHDFGDAIRFAANRTAEDSPNISDVGVDMEVFGAFADGFLARLASVLTKTEIETLAVSCFAITVEQAVRFLDDYILGSPYFKIKCPEHNLIRARCQIALAKDMLNKLGEMERVISELGRRYR